MKKFYKVLFVLFAFLIVSAIAGYIYILKAFPKVDDAPNLQVNVTPELLKRGEYLFNHVTGCADCHSTRDYSKFAGPLVQGTKGKGGFEFTKEFGLPGTFAARNITPAGLSGWSDGEIFRAITEGVSKDGEPLFPIMPFQAFGKMDKNDIYAIIAYLKTLPPIVNKVSEPKPEFPMNLIMRTIPAKNDFHPMPDKSNSVEYGKYLVNAAGCNDCHTQQEKGEYKMNLYLAGGQEFILPGNVIIRPANITPDKENGIGTWTKEMFIARFRTYTEGVYNAPQVKEGEFNTIMPWTFLAGMTDEDLGAIYDYLRTVKPIPNSVKKFEKKP